MSGRWGKKSSGILSTSKKPPEHNRPLGPRGHPAMQNIKTYNNPFWEKSNPGRNKERRKRTKTLLKVDN
jgi:hypothetical protein